jgi:hypothetical protein
MCFDFENDEESTGTPTPTGSGSSVGSSSTSNMFVEAMANLFSTTPRAAAPTPVTTPAPAVLPASEKLSAAVLADKLLLAALSIFREELLIKFFGAVPGSLEEDVFRRMYRSVESLVATMGDTDSSSQEAKHEDEDDVCDCDDEEEDEEEEDDEDAPFSIPSFVAERAKGYLKPEDSDLEKRLDGLEAALSTLYSLAPLGSDIEDVFEHLADEVSGIRTSVHSLVSNSKKPPKFEITINGRAIEM